MRGVVTLGAAVGLPKPVEERLREPRDQGAAPSRRPEDRPPQRRPGEGRLSQPGVPEVGARLTVRTLQDREQARQVGGQGAEARQVDHDDGRGRAVAVRCPASVLLVAASRVHHRFDRPARPDGGASSASIRIPPSNASSAQAASSGSSSSLIPLPHATGAALPRCACAVPPLSPRNRAERPGRTPGHCGDAGVPETDTVRRACSSLADSRGRP